MPVKAKRKISKTQAPIDNKIRKLQKDKSNKNSDKKFLKSFYVKISSQHTCFHGPLLEFTHNLPDSNQNTLPNFFCCSFDRNLKLGQCQAGFKSSQANFEKFSQNFRKRLKVDQKPELSDLTCKTTDRQNAQYLISDRSLEFLETCFLSKFTNCICIGTPKIHDFLTRRKTENSSKTQNWNSILLDIDDRFQLIFPETFVRFNMFNCHFFEKSDQFLNLASKFDPDQPILVLADPPFGGVTSAFVDSLVKLKNEILPGVELKMAYLFPNFFEREIVQAFSKLETKLEPVNFIVDYENHPKFLNKLTGHKSSPVRIFTDVKLDAQILENLDSKFLTDLNSEKVVKFCKNSKQLEFIGSQFCKICQKSYGHANSKFRHCHLCQICVKEKWRHCKKCVKCQPEYHNCRVSR